MFNFLRIRLLGWRLARELWRSMRDDPSSWIEVCPIHPHAAQVSNDRFKITIYPCWPVPCCRICENLRLCNIKGGDIYLGPIVRMRLRGAVRRWVLTQALN